MLIDRLHWILVVVCMLALCGVSRAFGAETDAAADAWLGDIPIPDKNYVQDGSFENQGKGWTWFVYKGGKITTEDSSRDGAVFHMGDKNTEQNYYYYQYNIPLEVGKTYTFSAMIKSEGISEAKRQAGALILTDYSWTSKSIPLEPPATTSGWTRVSKTFVAPETKLHANGDPIYNIVIHWPPNNAGSVWIDEVQVEEGSQATDFEAMYAGHARDALAKLRTLARQIFAAEDALEKLPASDSIGDLKSRLSGVRKQASLLRKQLLAYTTLSDQTRANLGKRIDEALGELALVRTLIWTGPAHVPLSEVRLPDSFDDQLKLSMTCLRGEHRDIALNVASLSGNDYGMKLTPSVLYNERLGLKLTGPKWLKVYAVPMIRGDQNIVSAFTDPLPEINNAGITPIASGRINQLVFSVDTSDLPPGEYTASIDVESLLDADSQRTIEIDLTVLPEALMPLASEIRVLECFGSMDYAEQAMIDLGVNTFDVITAEIDVTFDDAGKLLRSDFSRTDIDVRRMLEIVPDAQFLFLSGEDMRRKISRLKGWELTLEDKRFERAFKEWVAAIVEHFATLGVGPERLIMETYDEPQPSDYAAGTAMAQWTKQVEPKMLTQFYGSGVVQNEAWKQNAMAHDIVGPIVSACSPENMAFVQSLGVTLWTYDCMAYGETFHPIAYYRLMPWMCRKYNQVGWGHYSWFNTSHDRAYKAWQGVEAQNLVYPAADGEGMVVSRRYLAIRAGQEDYRVLDALQRVADRAGKSTQAQAFIAEAYDQALAMAPREKGYETQIDPGIPADRVDVLREQAVDRIAAMLPDAINVKASMVETTGTTSVSVNAPEGGQLHLRYLVDGRLPWRTMSQAVASGQSEIVLPEISGRVNRCLVELAGEGGRIWSGSATIIPEITVDSTSTPYDARHLSDGICVPAVKFEPNYAWISGPGGTDHWVELDLGEVRDVSELRLYWMTFSTLPEKIGVRYQSEDYNWMPVPSRPEWYAPTEPLELVELDGLRTRKIRIIQAANGGAATTPTLMGLSEVDIK